tara:strand:- start:206 stop:1369 length:1164 start_codon:yes stop_codon:yes gene_type:complete
MAVRKPLYYDAGDLKEMTTAMVNTIVEECVYQYSLDISVALSVVASGGNLGSITDTRQQAGAVHTHNSSFPSEATTNEPTTVTITYNKIQQTVSAGNPTIDTGWLWPAYKRSDGDIQSMNLDDVKDTFLHPAIDLLSSASLTSAQAGTYHINTSTSVGGSTLISATPIFVNTQADTSLYTADAAGLGDTENKAYASGGVSGSNSVTMSDVNNITVGMTIWRTDNSTLPDKTSSPTTITSIDGNTLYLSQNFTSQASGTYRIGGEALDQPITVTSYYLHKINGVATTTDIPLYLRQADNNLQYYTEANFGTYLKEWMKKTAAESGDGFKLVYSYTSGTNRGSGMPDTILTGSGDHKTYKYDGDDYRSQEFPNGSAVTANTWYLKLQKL